MHGWGIIGTGDISANLASDLLRVQPHAIRGVWGRTLERARAFAGIHGAPFATATLAELLERDDIDIVYIATPATTHTEIALEAIAAGKHVLIEKPLALTADETAAVLAAARSRGVFAMEAMWMRFNPLHVEVRDRIADGLLGEISSVRASFGTPFSPRPGKNTPADGGSILRDRGIYPITLADWFLGEPVSVTATGSLLDGVDIRGHATLESSDHGFAHLAWSGVEFLDLSATISGERGWVVIDPMFWAGSQARVHAGSVDRIFGSPEPIEHPRIGNGYGDMLGAVIRALDDGLLEHPWHSHEATVSVARTMDLVLAEITSAP